MVPRRLPDRPYAPSTPALKDVKLEVQSGEFVVALGASGCRKSTLFNLLVSFKDGASVLVLVLRRAPVRVNETSPSRLPEGAIIEQSGWRYLASTPQAVKA